MFQQQVQDLINDEFGGVDMISEACQLLDQMTPEQIKKLFLIACNQVGQAIRETDQEDPIDLARSFNFGILTVISVYQDAQLAAKATVLGQEGHA